MAPAFTEQQLADLDVARQLAAAGVPLFLATPDPSAAVGFRLPSAWQTTAPDPSIVDTWQPGMALCAVMGHGLDLVDIDPRNGGDLTPLDGVPTAHAVAATPSGGLHLFISSIGVGSRDNIAPGLDFKGGVSGDGHGFAFLAPTVRPSKVTGEPTPYRWVQPLNGPLPAPGSDTSGASLAARVRALRADGGVAKAGGPDWWQTFLTSSEPQSAVAAEKAITTKLAEIADWKADSGVGFRQTMQRAALTLGGYVGGGYLAEGDAWARLEQAAAGVWGAADDDDRRWIQQGLTDGAHQPFHVYTAEDEALYGEAAQAVAGEGEQPAGTEIGPAGPWNVRSVLDPAQPFDPAYASSDQELAQAVAYRMYPVLRYAKDGAVWVKRERDVWEEAKDDQITIDWIVSLIAELMPPGLTPVPKDLSERRPEHWQAVRRATFLSSAGTGKIGRKLRAVVRSDHPVTVRLADLDANPDVLWAGGVPWDLRASRDVPTPAGWIDPSTPHLRTAACAPDPSVPTTRWDTFTAAVLPDPEVRAWALRVLSIALTGYADAALPVLYGRERSGKTSLIEILVTVLGSYARAANPKLLSSQDSSHDAIVYDLRGRRLAFIDEGPKRGHEATERLKQLTGGGSLTARALYGNPITFAPAHTLVMTTNNEPHLTDPALRARMRLIPCDEPEALVRPARLPLLGAGLAQEAPGILAAMMREAAGYLTDRDTAGTSAAPISIRGMAQEMAEGQDPVREWVENCTVPSDPGTPGRVLHGQHFAGWHQAHPLYRRMTVPTETAFGRVLTDMGYPAQQVGGKRYRPLSVLTGQFGGVTPTPQAYMAGSGGFVAGSEAQPANEHNPTSTPVFSSTSGGLAGIEEENRKEKVEETYREIGGESVGVPASLGNRGPTEGLTCDDERGGLGFSNPPATPNGVLKSENALFEEPTRALTCGDASPRATGVPLSPAPRDVDRSEVARRAHEAKITKAEARRQLAEEKRLAAIVAAQGEVLALPVVVDRAGHTIPVSLEQAAEVVRSAIARSGQLDVDVETSGYPVGHPLYALRSVQLGDALAVVVLHPVTHADLIAALVAEAPALGAFSATADLVPLAYAGLGDHDEMWSRMHDVVIPAKLADPRSTNAKADGLKALATAVLRDAAVAPAAEEARSNLFKLGKWLKETEVMTPAEKSGWLQVETGSEVMLRYAASDVLDTAALGRTIPPPPPAVYERERLAQRMTARIAFHGVRIDGEHVAALTGPALEARAEAGARVMAFGIKKPGSGPEIGAAMLALGADLPRSVKTGAPSVAKGVIEPLRATEGPAGDLARAVLDYRHHNTVLTLFLEPYRLLTDAGDGRARPTIYTVGTNTGRMSAVRPNLQQLPRQGGVRACLTADPGQLMIGADFSGVEVRVAAALSQDPTLLAFLRDGRDLHTEIAKMAFGEAAAKAERYRVKPMVFGRLYGGGVKTLAAQGGVTIEVAQRVIDALDALTPGLTAWSSSMRMAAQQGRTQFQSYSGRTIHLPQDQPHAAGNYGIQGTARELLVDALVRWRDTRWGNAVLLPVHDELDVFVPEAEAAEATEALVTCMQTELYGVAIVADPSEPSFAWADST